MTVDDDDDWSDSVLRGVAASPARTPPSRAVVAVLARLDDAQAGRADVVRRCREILSRFSPSVVEVGSGRIRATVCACRDVRDRVSAAADAALAVLHESASATVSVATVGVGASEDAAIEEAIRLVEAMAVGARQRGVFIDGETLSLLRPTFDCEALTEGAQLLGRREIAGDGGGLRPGADLARGESVGRFVLLDRLGAGGSSVVWSAYDPELDRRVALKFLRPGAPSSSSGSDGLLRLAREAQALARLSHPNVLAIHDVGPFGSGLYIAEELVVGGSLATYLSDAPRTVADILAVFMQAGRGLSAAHRAGLVHRDFKPANVLVGSDGHVKVADFGLARLSGVDEPKELGLGRGSSLEHRTARTAPQATLPSPRVPDRSAPQRPLTTPITLTGALLGTPAYMSPEQHCGEPADARSDQFSFCVSLYEALYREAPFAGQTNADWLQETTRGRVRNAPRASRVPGWLRTVLLRGLRPGREERFVSMDALLAALSRDPVARRRRSLFVALGAVVMALVGGLAVRAFRQPAVCPSAASELVGLWDDERSTAVHKAFAATGASYAEVAFGSVRRALDAYAAAWVSMRDDACRATRVRGVQSGEALDLRMQCLAQRRQALATAVRLFASADGGTLETAVDTADALPSVWDCANVAALRAPLRLPDDPAKRRRVEEIREELSATDVLASTGRFDDALGRARALVTDAERTDYRPVLAEALLLQGSVMISRREDDAAIGVLDRAVRTAVAGRHESVEAAAWTKMVTAAAWGTRRADGATFADHARAGLERSPDEALHADLEVARGELAQRLGNLDEAIAIEREALAIVERLHGRDSAAAAACLSKLSTSLHKKERDEEALTHARRALSIFEAVRGAGHPSVAVALNNLANDLRGLGRLNEALDAYRRAYAIKVATEGPSSPRTANTLANIGIVLAAQGKVAEAIQDEAQALEIRRRALGNEHTDVALTLENLAEMMLAVRRTDEAVKLADDALSIRTRVQGPDSPFCVVPLVDLALGHADQGDARGALTFAERALTIALAQHAVPEDLASARLAVAVALSGAKTDPARAETLGSQAREVFAAKPALYGTQLARLDALSVHTRR